MATHARYLVGWLKFRRMFWDTAVEAEGVADSVPVNCSCSIRYSWGSWAKRVRSAVSRNT